MSVSRGAQEKRNEFLISRRVDGSKGLLLLACPNEECQAHWHAVRYWNKALGKYLMGDLREAYCPACGTLGKPTTMTEYQGWASDPMADLELILSHRPAGEKRRAA